MIRYTLACESGHGFESWFPSGDAYDEQAARGLVSCPICDSHKVSKALMSPAVARTDKGPTGKAAPDTSDETPVTAPATTQAEAAFPMIAEPERRLRALLRAVREQVTRTADDVGTRFPDEARAMHYGDTPARAIYGEASLDEARALVEEGIEVAPLPPAPDDRH
ncbi:DUF1178 family protein [Methylobacterium haplocladii]|uniref:Uncharacterized protein n=1 Tax=Methylobacterium haplocladii TaxID=1176176 RepID=A0A512IMA9_9HYPH|nr:DUF1178 family protein [Methylobacterium haplocladii]GEO98844.1 hypothetical protein MHA02_12320 [Methylobacterium haplocladii]GJD85139.1 hypothetical protein HPGCJGGD_3025 [Methylobacterium haplocladii]GLS58778.1 hypothetical protein GCM10007887_14430 [Methylobacterium haplocladii]